MGQNNAGAMIKSWSINLKAVFVVLQAIDPATMLDLVLWSGQPGVRSMTLF